MSETQTDIMWRHIKALTEISEMKDRQIAVLEQQLGDRK